jgi:hypothetical protein
VNGKCSSRRWLQADFVVHRISEPLLAAQVSLRGLNTYMSEQELDLIKLSACLVAQSGTGTAEIVRRNAKPLGAIRRALLIARKTGPVEVPAAVNQLSPASLTQVGTGTVRT